VLFLSCKANAKVKLAKSGHGPQHFRIIFFCVVLVIVLCYRLYAVLFLLCCTVIVFLCYYLCCPMYWLWVLYHCHRVLAQLQLRNISIKEKLCTPATKVATSFLSSSSVNLTPSCNASNSRSKNAFLFFMPVELKHENLSALEFREMSYLPSAVFTPRLVQKAFIHFGNSFSLEGLLHKYCSIQGVTGGQDQTSGECSLC